MSRRTSIGPTNGMESGRTDFRSFLRDADYVMTFNEDKWITDLSITVTMAQAARLYVFYDARLVTPAWLSDRFADLGVSIGLDEDSWSSGPPQALGQGPGQSIDTVFSVWSCDLAADEAISLGNLGSKEHQSGNAMYGIAAVARP